MYHFNLEYDVVYFLIFILRRPGVGTAYIERNQMKNNTMSSRETHK